MGAYFSALLHDLKYQLNALPAGHKISSVFFGGGTPSLIEAHFYEPIFTAFSPYLAENFELTMEANPNSLAKPWLKRMLGLGLNRLSLGTQSFDAEKLHFLGRDHSKNESISAVKLAQDLGLANINLDLIYGTKLDDGSLLERELETLSGLNLAHVSAYSLSIEQNTRFGGALGIDKKGYAKDDEDLARFFVKGLKDLGFIQYEISNFAASAKDKCRHNLGYWAGQEYLGVGLSAVGFWRKRRSYTHEGLKSYIKDPLYRRNEVLKDSDLALESLFLGLRSDLGVDTKLLKGSQKLELIKDLIRIDNSRIYNKDYFLADELALFLSEDL